LALREAQNREMQCLEAFPQRRDGKMHGQTPYRDPGIDPVVEIGVEPATETMRGVRIRTLQSFPVAPIYLGLTQ